MKLLLTILSLFFSLSIFAQTTHIEAEKWLRMKGVQTEVTTDINGGLDVGYIDSSDWCDYSYVAPIGGVYTVDFRIAKAYADMSQISFKYYASDNLLYTAGTFNVPMTGGFQNWTTTRVNFTLKAGQQTIRLYFPKGDFNINWFEITPYANTPAPTTSTQSIAALQTQIDTLKAQIQQLKNSPPYKLFFKTSNLKGTGDSLTPYYFIPTTP